MVENIAVAVEGKFDLRDLAARVRDLSVKYGLPVDPNRVLHHLSVGERQRVEIIRALLQEPKLLILDEPTSVLTPQAVRGLFETLRVLAAEGRSILYISHKLDEIRELCDSATVLRAGKVAGTADPKQASSATLARLMVGSSLPQTHRGASRPEAQPRFEAVHLSVSSDDPFGTSIEEVNFAVRGGEILGIAGGSGNGQAERAEILSGEQVAPVPDSLRFEGKPIAHLDAKARRALGLTFVPEDRLGRGVVPTMNLVANSLLTGYIRGMVRHGVVDRRKARDFATDVVGRFNVKCNGVRSIARNLSGGNLQKFIVGREISLAPQVLLVAQPTWGVDVAASAFIRQTLIDLSRAGTAILVISEDLEELLEVSDRIMVLHRGRLSASMPREAADVEKIGLLMAGTRETETSAVDAA